MTPPPPRPPPPPPSTTQVFLGGGRAAASSSSSPQQQSLPAVVLDLLASVPVAARLEGVSPEASDVLRAVCVKTVRW
jgi:hypothetical protein